MARYQSALSGLPEENQVDHNGPTVSSSSTAGGSRTAAGGLPPPEQRGSKASNAEDEELSTYAFFAKYTYSLECALLAFNFHELITELKVFELFPHKYDKRLASVTLSFLFYKYQIHHCDMALDLSLTCVYLEDLAKADPSVREFADNDAFNVICYLAFLAHVYNADRTIRLRDWYQEIGKRHFSNLKKLNTFVFYLFKNIRKFRLATSESRVKKYTQKLCAVPPQHRNSAGEVKPGDAKPAPPPPA